MRTVKLSLIFLVFIFTLFLNGCGSDLKIQNDIQRARIAELESEIQATKIQLDQMKRKLDTAEGSNNIELKALQQKIAALEEDLAKKKELISSMQQQLLSGTSLPVELVTMLEDFAKGKDMVEYDSNKGIVKFKSDLLFELGSDNIAPEAEKVIKSLCEILNSEQGKKFDIVIAGHTDDINRFKASTRAKHPNNWYLSAHRAISVLEIMANSGVNPERISVRGFGEYRPIAPNKPGRKGNALNRRVEIYIVPKGM